MARRAPTAEEPTHAPEGAAPDADATPIEDETDAAVAAGEAEPSAEPPPRRRGRPRGSRNARPAATEPAATAPDGTADAAPEPARAPRQSGAETHAAVKRLLRSGSLTHTQAFERLAAESGRRASAISAAYYRIERAAGARAPRRTPRATATPATVRPEPTGTAAALAAARAALDRLADAVERQERELARSEAERERYLKIRDIVGAELPSAPAGRRRR